MMKGGGRLGRLPPDFFSATDIKVIRVRPRI